MANFKCTYKTPYQLTVCYGQYDASTFQPDGDLVVPSIIVCISNGTISYDQKVMFIDRDELEEITDEQLQKVADTIHQVEDKQAEIDKLLTSLLS